MEEDMENGMFPFFVATTLGTTGCVAFDNLDEIGEANYSADFLRYSQRLYSKIFCE